MKKTKVIFRKFDDGDIIALFPSIAGTSDYLRTCESYMHVGQHGSSHLGVLEITDPATEKEYTSLAVELESIGYTLRVAKRLTAKDQANRKAMVSE